MRKVLFFAAIWLLICSRLVAQSRVDSLKAELARAQNDSARLHTLLALTQAMLNSQNISTLEYLKQAEAIALKDFGPKETCRLWLRYGRYYSFAGDFEKAAQYYLKAMEDAEKARDTEIVQYAMNNFAVLNIQIKNYDKGIETFDRLVQIARQQGDRNAETEYLLNLATAYGEKGDLNRSEEYLLAVYNSAADLFYRIVAANNLSFVCNLAGRHREAERYAREAIRAWDRLQNVQLYLQSLTNLSNALIGQKQYREARRVTEKLIRIAKVNHFQQEYVDGLGNLAEILEGLGDYRSALRYQKEYAARKDSLLIEENLRQINELQIKYETKEKEREIALRTEQLRGAKMKLRFVGAVLILTAIFAGVVSNLYAKKVRAYKELVRKNLELMASENVIHNLEREIHKSKSRRRRRTKTRSAVSSIPEERKAKLVGQLRKALQEEKVYLKSDLTLEKLAAEMNVSSKYLSQVIRAHYGTTFPNLVNRLRISEARRLLADRRFRHYSIEGIARTVGFSSKSAFNVAFKRITGLTPSYFRESVANFTQVAESETP